MIKTRSLHSSDVQSRKLLIALVAGILSKISNALNAFLVARPGSWRIAGYTYGEQRLV